MSAAVVADDPGQQAYLATVDGQTAGLAAYVRSPGLVVFTHTQVEDAYEGTGVGGALVRGALNDARARGEKVDPQCSFVAGWIARHEDYKDLLQAE